MIRRSALFLALLCFLTMLVSCGGTKFTDKGDCQAGKISFDLAQLDENGLFGPADGKRALDFEFCIPNDEQYLAEIRGIDPDIHCSPGSRGRIGCTEEQALCLGNTVGKDYRATLCRLSNLEYITRIDQNFWE